MKFLNSVFLTITLLGLTACGGGGHQGPANPIPQMTGAFDPSKEALVFFKAVEGEDAEDASLLKIYIQKEGTSQIQEYICADPENNAPIAERLAPGRYLIVVVSGNILATVTEPVPVVTFDPAKGLPLTPIDVKAGDVLYVGNIFVDGINNNAARGRADGITYKVEDHSDLAKQAVTTYYPDQASKLQTKLIKVLP
ncbi:MAG: hypothetical protein Q7T44_12620 [Parvibaculum sp.]|nr:hypothetical protein [Parvibaculum sp.]